MLNFGRALVDFRDARVAVVPLGGHVRDVAHAAEDLDRLVAAHGCRLRGGQFRHGGLPRVLEAGVLELRRAPRQEPGRIAGQYHEADFVLDQLLLGNRLAKGVALQRVLDGAINGSGGDAERLAGDADATPVQRCHGNLESLAKLAHQVFGRDADPVHDEIRRRRRADAELLLLGAQRKAFGVGGNDKG